MTNAQKKEKITEIELLEAQIKELKAIADLAKAEIKAELDAQNVDCIDTGIHRVFYEAYEKKVVDTKALKADGLYEKYSKAQTNLMFKITSVTNA